MVAIGPIVSEEKSFEIVDGRTMDGLRTMGPTYTISSPGAFSSGELKSMSSYRFPGQQPLPKMGFLLKERICSKRSKFFHLRTDPAEREAK